MIKVQIIAEIFCQNGTMQGADDLNIESGGFFEQTLHLCAVFANDTDIISSGFTSPILFHVQSAEFTKTVCTEQYFVLIVISYDNFRPMYHRSGDEMQGMFTEGKSIAFSDDNPSVLKLRTEEIAHHGEGFGAGNNGSLRIVIHKVKDIGTVIGFHVLYDEIIGFTAIECIFEIIEPFLGKAAVNGIHDGNFIIKDDIGIVGHAVGDDILSLKEINFVVIHTHIADSIGDIHKASSFAIY